LNSVAASLSFVTGNPVDTNLVVSAVGISTSFEVDFNSLVDTNTIVHVATGSASYATASSIDSNINISSVVGSISTPLDKNSLINSNINVQGVIASASFPITTIVRVTRRKYLRTPNLGVI